VTLVVLFILAAMWAAVLLPPWLRNRTESRPADSIVSFRKQLSVLERTTPGTTVAAPVTRIGALSGMTMQGSTAGQLSQSAPISLREAQKRRRDILFGLLAAMGGSLLIGLLPGLRVMLGLHLLLDLLFVGYIALLVQARKAAEERSMKVRYLPANVRTPEPALLLRRSAN
jgi:hypothetical protein